MSQKIKSITTPNQEKFKTLENRKKIDAQDRLALIILLMLVQILGYVVFYFFRIKLEIFYVFITIILTIQISLSYPIIAFLTHKIYFK
jgi:hypothetical protein